MFALKRILILLLFSQNALAANFEHANAHGSMAGEIGSLYLQPSGVSIHPLPNDWLGDTDKLLTAYAKVGLLKTTNDQSYELTTNWRMLTPISKRKFGEPDLQTPIGRFADWGEVKLAYAKTRQLKSGMTKIQLSAGLGHIGNKGGKEIHRGIHIMTNNQVEQLEYDDQPKGITLSHGIQFAFASKYNNQIAVGFHSSKFLNDFYLQLNQIVDLDFVKFGFETSLVRQSNSQVYERLNEFRREAAFSFAVNEYYHPAIKWISAYLPGDKYGQIYADLINVTIPL